MLKKLIIVDANSLIHRAFHALPPFKTKKGELVNAVYGFYSILINILTRIKPDYLAVCFDVKKKTFRHEVYKEYKAKRVKAPDELYAQFDRIKELLNILEFPIFQKEGFEADDVIATVADKVETDPNIHVYVVTSDKDALQLVNDQTFVVSPAKGGTDNKIYNPETVVERFGLTSDQIIDFKAIMGDNSDNIPGVVGIGEKGATNLLQKYKTLDGIYENLDEITGATHKKLSEQKEGAYFSQKLVTLVHDVPIDFDLEKTKYNPEDFGKALPLFEELEFRSLIGRLQKILPYKPKEEDKPVQASLF
ncbi:5'-3' exonuclease H3TH domain-containing protein [Patescibacteria group bacterium]